MKKLLTIAALLLVFAGSNLFAQSTTPEDPDLLYATELLKPGTPAPDFTLNDLQGSPVSLSDFRGRTVVLVFWASWCPDCREELPMLRDMHAAADPEKVVFVSVSFDRTREALEKFASTNPLPGIQLFDAAGKKDSLVGELFKVNWIPSLYVIDPSGEVALSTVVAAKVDAFLKN